MLSSPPSLTPQARPSLLRAALPTRAAAWRSTPGFRRALRLPRRCRVRDEGGFDLEAEIMGFMTDSGKPEAFPSRRELVDGGRRDLADAIVENGGWMALGWNVDGEEEETPSSATVSSCPYDEDYPRATSSLGGSSEIGSSESESGIEGILNRLEKERNSALGFSASGNKECGFSESDAANEDWHSEFSTDATVARPFRSRNSSSLNPKEAISDQSGVRNQNNSFSDFDGIRDSNELDMWRSWIIQRAGVSKINSEDTEILSSETSKDGSMEVSKYGIRRPEKDIEFSETDQLGSKKHGEINHNQLKSRLQHLELELSTVLQAVRSNADEIPVEKDKEGSSDDLEKLSDAWEFQQNDIMNAQDKLRSTRAKLAVLEGKMALALIDSQKITDKKQKRIDNALRALRLLRSTRVVWPNSASEVLLTGSFDGWSSKRKMEKSKTGVFSLTLQLYPGRYEIKFIVDGEWRIDPLRVVVNNNGHENNLLIVT